MELEALTHQIIGGAIEVHRALGPGLLESAYGRCLALELRDRAVRFQTEVPIPLSYKGLVLNAAYRADFVVENCLLVELKTVHRLEPVHRAQLNTYLKLTGLTVGLLLNFNTHVLRNGIVRVVR